MPNLTRATRTFVVALLATGTLLPMTAAADSGLYVGVSAGGATLDAEFDVSDFPELPSSIDEDDTAFKVFLGYTLDLPVLTLGVEGGYVNFGEPEIPLTGIPGIEEISIETTGLNLWGTAGVDVGPIDVFAKLGFVQWDVEAGIQGFPSVDDDGTDMGYGIGAAFNLGSLQIRGEYEVYDLDDTDIEMLSVGVAFRF